MSVYNTQQLYVLCHHNDIRKMNSIQFLKSNFNRRNLLFSVSLTFSQRISFFGLINTQRSEREREFSVRYVFDHFQIYIERKAMQDFKRKRRGERIRSVFASLCFVSFFVVVQHGESACVHTCFEARDSLVKVKRFHFFLF